MTLVELKSQLICRELNAFYIFTGEETGVRDRYLKEMCEAVGADLVKLDRIAGNTSKLNTKNVLGKKTIFLVYEDKDVITNEKVIRDLVRGRMQGQNTVILYYSKLDKRTQFYKTYGEDAVSFDRLPTPQLIKYAGKEVELAEGQAKRLVELCQNDYTRLMHECDKIRTLAKARNIKESTAFIQGQKDGLFFEPPEDAIFLFTDAFTEGNAKRAAHFLGHCEQIGEPPMVLVTVLYTNFRNMLILKFDGGGKGVVERTGIPAFQAKIAMDRAKKFSQYELINAVQLIRSVEKGIKQGKVDPTTAIYYLMTQIL